MPDLGKLVESVKEPRNAVILLGTALASVASIQLGLENFTFSEVAWAFIIPLIISACAATVSLFVWLLMSLATWSCRLYGKATGRKSTPTEGHIPYGYGVPFEERFARAFPGIRQTEWLSGRSTARRLKVFFAAKGEHSWLSDPENPSRFSDILLMTPEASEPSDFRVLRGRTVLIGEFECKIERLAAIYSFIDERKAIYIECAAQDSASSLIRGKHIRTQPSTATLWKSERFALWRRFITVSWAEYQDGSANILGRSVTLDGRVEGRVRNLERCAFLLVPKRSHLYDDFSKALLKNELESVLSKRRSVEELIDRLRLGNPF